MNSPRNHPPALLRRRLACRSVLLLLCLSLLCPPTALAQIFRGYYSSGELKFKTRKNRHREIIKGYYPGGALHFVATYHRGRLDGVTKEYYSSGVLKSEITYERGKRDGLAKFYYENGMLRCKIGYRKDRETGQAKFYDENGLLVKTVPIERQRLRQKRRAAQSTIADSTLPPSAVVPQTR